MLALLHSGLHPEGVRAGIVQPRSHACWWPGLCKELGGRQRVLLVAGKASSRAKQEFEKAGFVLRSGLRP